MTGRAKLSKPRIMKIRVFRKPLRLSLPVSTCTCDRLEPLLDPYLVLPVGAPSTEAVTRWATVSSFADGMHHTFFRSRDKESKPKKMNAKAKGPIRATSLLVNCWYIPSHSRFGNTHPPLGGFYSTYIRSIHQTRNIAIISPMM